MEHLLQRLYGVDVPDFPDPPPEVLYIWDPHVEPRARLYSGLKSWTQSLSVSVLRQMHSLVMLLSVIHSIFLQSVWYRTAVLHRFWWKRVATLPWGARDTSLFWLAPYAPGHPLRVFVMHSALPACPQPLLVRSLQLVEVWPYSEEEEEINNE